MGPILCLLPLLPLLLVLAGCQQFTAPLRSEPPVGVAGETTTPRPRLEAGLGTAMIRSIDVDASGRWLLTASDDQLLRLWSLSDGTLLRSYRPPMEAGDAGRLYVAALSPDGRWVAGAGWSDDGTQEADTIYLFDRAGGKIDGRLSWNGNAIHHFCFSPDGRYLGATLGGGEGLRVWSMEGFRQLLSDRDYRDASYWCAFAADGRLVTTSDDGYLRLYDHELRLTLKTRASGGQKPLAAVFSPDGRHIAVGFADSAAVNVLDARDLSLAYALETRGNDSLGNVAWSADGRRLYAGGSYRTDGNTALLAWTEAAPRQAFPLAEQTLIDMRPLPDGGLAVATADPAWIVLDGQGRERLARRAIIPDMRNKLGHHLTLSPDGSRIRLGLGYGGRQPVRFDLAQPGLIPTPGTDPELAPPRTEGLPISGWDYSRKPRLDGHLLPLNSHEWSRSLAIAPDRQRFLLGADWSLRLFDRNGRELWSRPVPGVVWGLNISGDGRLAVAAYGDGTLRWHRLEDGRELLALFPHRDGKQWVLWTPDGFFDSSPGAERLIGYRIDRGSDRDAGFVGVDQLYDAFYRPDLVSAALGPDYDFLAREALALIGDVRQVLDGGLAPALTLEGESRVLSKDGRVRLAVGVRDQGGGIGRVVYRVDGVAQPAGRGVDLSPGGGGRLDRPFTLPPGRHTLSVTAYNRSGQVESRPVEMVAEVAEVPDWQQHTPRLHVLAAGIDDYRMHDLKLKFAAGDARAITRGLRRHGRNLYDPGEIRLLTNRKVTAPAIRTAFSEMTEAMAPEDLFVFFLAGHGEVRDGRYLFIPADLVWENETALRDGALDQPAFEELLAAVPAQKSLVLLDTCHAGSWGEGRSWSRGADERTAIGHLIKATGRAVIAASGSEQMALEGEGGHGVFTFTLLEGLRGAARGNDRLVSVDELARHVRRRVPEITLKRWSYEQFPMYDVRGMDFPLVRVNSD